MKLKDQLNSYLQKIIENITGEKAEIEIQSVQESVHGDYSTSLALKIFPKVKDKFKNPLEFAKKIAGELEKIPELSNILEKAEAAVPGFINLWLKDVALFRNLEEVIGYKDEYGKEERLKNKKIMLEFADPNPFKEFHIGHLRNISLGESYARLIEFEGGEVFRVNYQGDVGMHVAKALYGIQNSKVKMQNLKSKVKRSKFLGEAYAMGTRACEEDKKAKKEIEEINLKIYQKSDPKLKKLWEEGRKWSLDHFEEIYKRVGTKYKRYYFESEVAQRGREIVLSHLEDGVFEEHEGAIVFRGSHTRVFVTSQDYATYEAKDLGLAKIKYSEFPYDQSIIITANEQEGYFKVVLEAMKKIFPILASKTVHNSFGFVKLKDGKMSSRSGNIVAGEWLLDEAKKRIKAQFVDMDEKTLENVAVGAVKYSMLKFSRASDITFSFEESISISGNSGPYIQYTYARTQSVLAKSPAFAKASAGKQNPKLEEEELIVLRTLVHFPEIVEEAAANFAPNLLCNYLFDLSQKFNNFYQKHKILQSKNEDFRLSLTSAVGQILKTGLYLLGIESPEKM